MSRSMFLLVAAALVFVNFSIASGQVFTVSDSVGDWPNNGSLQIPNAIVDRPELGVTLPIHLQIQNPYNSYVKLFSPDNTIRWYENEGVVVGGHIISDTLIMVGSSHADTSIDEKLGELKIIFSKKERNFHHLYWILGLAVAPRQGQNIRTVYKEISGLTVIQVRRNLPLKLKPESITASDSSFISWEGSGNVVINVALPDHRRQEIFPSSGWIVPVRTELISNWPTSLDGKSMLPASIEVSAFSPAENTLYRTHLLVDAMPGDLNIDGKIDETDLVEFVELGLEERNLSRYHFMVADYNRDGARDMLDAWLILGRVVGLEQFSDNKIQYLSPKDRDRVKEKINGVGRGLEQMEGISPEARAYIKAMLTELAAELDKQ